MPKKWLSKNAKTPCVDLQSLIYYPVVQFKLKRLSHLALHLHIDPTNRAQLSSALICQENPTSRNGRKTSLPSSCPSSASCRRRRGSGKMQKLAATTVLAATPIRSPTRPEFSVVSVSVGSIPNVCMCGTRLSSIHPERCGTARVARMRRQPEGLLRNRRQR